MRRPGLVPAVALVAALLSACAGQQTPSGPPSTAVLGAPGTYQASGTVLESPEHGPQLCHVVMESLPPQCEGIDLVGWDWSAVDDEESASGTTWGSYGPWAS